MSEQRQAVWTVEDVQRVAAEEGIPLEGGGYSFSGLLTHPDGMSRAQIVSMLRTFANTPSDDQIGREVEATRNDLDLDEILKESSSRKRCPKEYHLDEECHCSCYDAVAQLVAEVRRLRIELWARISPSSNLHSSSCQSGCRDPKHFPDSDPLDQDE